MYLLMRPPMEEERQGAMPPAVSTAPMIVAQPRTRNAKAAAVTIRMRRVRLFMTDSSVGLGDAIHPDADVLVVNTCSFIEGAKRESIEAILELAELKKQGSAERLIVNLRGLDCVTFVETVYATARWKGAAKWSRSSCRPSSA